jgi:hypothetical protein
MQSRGRGSPGAGGGAGAVSRRQVLKAGVPLAAAGLGVAGTACSRAPERPVPAPEPRMGINLAGLVDWNTERPFVDVFLCSRKWVSQAQGRDWGEGPPLELDAAGWVKRLDPGQWADTPMMSSDAGGHPPGAYRVLYEGKGELDCWGSGTVVSRSEGSLEVLVKPSQGSLWLKLKRTDAADPVRNIRVLPPGADASAPRQAFDADFLQRWEGMGAIRFMDWMKTNDSLQERWQDRPKPEDASFSLKGAPVEVMVDLANRLKSPPWFCMPHLADSDYVQRFAALVKERLDPGLKVFIEYSNEIWNGQFDQSKHARGGAEQLGLKLPAYVAHRSVQMFGIWESVFGGPERLVRILPSQAVNTWLSEEALMYKDTYERVDGLAIAPYLSMNLPPKGEGLTAGEVAGWSVELLMDHLETRGLADTVKDMHAQKAVADRYGVRLMAYEGGQHLTGIWGAENNEGLSRLFDAANAHPRMGALYSRYLDAWKAAGGDLFCHFNSVENWSKWGRWGLLQHAMQDPAASPKFMAAMAWAAQRGQPVRVPKG